MRKLVQELIRQEISELATNMEMESFEESDDFEIEDDPLDPITPYEAVFDPRDDRNPERAGGGSAPTEGGAVIAVSAPPSLSPTNGSGSPQLEPNVKRSESNVPSTGERLIGSDTGPSASVPTTRRPA
jgi:hypothetical protein